jgi:hypothetical protein
MLLKRRPVPKPRLLTLEAAGSRIGTADFADEAIEEVGEAHFRCGTYHPLDVRLASGKLIKIVDGGE